MAGVEFAKYGGSSLGELSVHFDNDIRADEKTVHSNVTINKELTYLNYYLGADSYTEIVDKIEKIIEEADATNPPKRLRKDRKTWFSLEVPCPPELEGTDQEDIFYQKSFDMYKEYLPGLVAAVINKDEKHEYLDSKKGEWVISRNHGHYIGACLTEDGRINAHDLLTKEMCQKVNDDIQELCLKEWGISYQTGEGRQGAKKTVEQLKSESAVRLQEKLAKEGLDVVYTMRQEKDTLQGEIADLKLVKQADTREVQNLDKQVEEKTEELIKINADKSKAEEDISTARTEKKDIDLEKALSKQELNKIKADINTKTALDKQITENLEKLTHPELMQTIAKGTPQEQGEALAVLCQKSAKYDQMKREHGFYKGIVDKQKDYDKYKEIADSIFISREDIDKAFKDETLTNRDISAMLKQYAIFQPDNEKEAIISVCNALDKIDAYNHKSYAQRNKSFMEKAENHNFDHFEEYDTRIRTMLKKSLTYEGRKDIYKGQDTLKNLWADIQTDNRNFWEKKKEKNKTAYEGYISLDKVFTAIVPQLIQTAINAIKSYIEMLKEQYDNQYENEYE